MKFQRSSADYLRRRAEMTSTTGQTDPWSVADHWPLYCGTAQLARTLAIYDLFRATMHVPGHVAEFGCHRGANLLFLAKVLRVLDPHGSKEVIGFDSFEGLTAFDESDGIARRQAGRYRGDLAELESMIRLHELDDEVQLCVGLIEDTLPELLAQRPELTFSFVYCDTDLHDSTAAVLALLDPRLSVGGKFVFDEWNHQHYPGEGIAANDFLARNRSHYVAEHVTGARRPTLTLTKLAT